MCFWNISQTIYSVNIILAPNDEVSFSLLILLRFCLPKRSVLDLTFRWDTMELSINKSLAEYTLNLLHKHNINTVIDFVKEDIYKLIQITNLEPEAITKLKNEFLHLLKPVQTETFGFELEIIKTGIDG